MHVYTNLHIYVYLHRHEHAHMHVRRQANLEPDPVFSAVLLMRFVSCWEKRREEASELGNAVFSSLRATVLSGETDSGVSVVVNTLSNIRKHFLPLCL